VNYSISKTNFCPIFANFDLYTNIVREAITDQKKPNRECLTERVLFPFHTHSRSRSVSVLYVFCISSVPVLYRFCALLVRFC